LGKHKKIDLRADFLLHLNLVGMLLRAGRCGRSDRPVAGAPTCDLMSEIRLRDWLLACT
jgi:hypothetical protein